MLGLDPTTFEIIWHRLLAIAEEMGITYMRCSGSQVLITGNDASTGIMLADGSLVAMGPYITTQGNVLPLMVEHTLRLNRANPGIEDGDIFICNDPYLGAIHHPDVATLAPVFHQGELFAWVAASGHQPDIGGMDPGGFSIRAVDTYQEGLRIPLVKLVERGRLREDILRWVLNQVRDPLVGLDVKAQIAANEAGRQRLLALVARYGAGAVQAAMEGSIAFTRERLRQRLRRLPDGCWTEVQHIDHDGHAENLYRVILTLDKRGDRLRLDFAGSSPQARGLINCTAGGLRAGVLTALYILLCHDLPWNRGVLDCLEIAAPEASVINCALPTPCAMATISAVIVVIDCVFRAMSRCLLASESDRDEAMACWTGSSMAPIAAGTSQHGFPFVNTEMSHFAGGGGARIDQDGVDTAGILFNTTPNIANVETIEQDFPLLYLFRRHLTDSGGPGQYRGGASGEIAYIVHDAPAGELEVAFSGTGAEMPNALGLAGGLPGAAIRVLRVRETGISELLARGAPLPARLNDIAGAAETMPQKHPRTPFLRGEAWYHHWQGGAGYGDPLDRAPEAVARDVARHLVSRESAVSIYGVVLDAAGAVDPAASARQREVIRNQRRRAESPTAPIDALDPAPLGSGWRITEHVEIIRSSGLTRCRRCGHALARSGMSHTSGCLKDSVPLTASGPNRGEAYDRGRFRLRLFYCPGCLTQLEAEIEAEGAPPATYVLSLGAAGLGGNA